MKRLLFLFQYIVNPRTVGAILPSSRYLGDKMVEELISRRLHTLSNTVKVRVYSQKNCLKKEGLRRLFY